MKGKGPLPTREPALTKDRSFVWCPFDEFLNGVEIAYGDSPESTVLALVSHNQIIKEWFFLYVKPF